MYSFHLWISAIFACKIREVIISVLTERAPLRRSLNSADAEKELRDLASWRRSHRHSERLVKSLSKKSLDLSLVALKKKKKKKSLWGSTKALNWQHCAHLYYSPLSLSDCSSTRDAFVNMHTHVQEYLDHGQSEGGSALHYL